MAANQYLAWAVGNGANVYPFAIYSAKAALALGIQNGTADPQLANTTWRQSSVVAAMIAQFIADNQPGDVLDDGNVASLEAKFKAALLSALESGEVLYCVDGGTADALMATPSPALTSYAAGQVVAILKNPQVGANATATPSLNISSLGAKTIVKGSGAQLVAGDLVAGALTLAVYDGSQFRHIGAALSTTDLRVQAGQAVVFQAAGTNAYTGSLIPAPASLTPRMEVLGAFGNANTASSAPTLQLNALGNPLPILKQAGGVPQPGDISGFVPLILNSAGTAWIINGVAISDVIVPAVAAVTVYTDSTSGSDATSTGSQTAPFKTNLKAYTYLAGRFSFGTFGATIQMLTAGQYDLPSALTAIPNLAILGNTSSPGTYVLTGTAASGASACCAVSGCSVKIDGATINNTTPTKSTLAAVAGGNLTLGNVNMTASATMTGSATHVLAGQGGAVGVSGALGIQQSAASILDGEGGNISVFGTIAVPSGGVFSNAVVVASGSGANVTLANGANTFSGSTSGKRFSSNLNATINTFGGGANFIPGSTAGTQTNGGQYA